MRARFSATRTRDAETGTRAQPGIPKRWAGGWLEHIDLALGWDNPEKRKSVSENRADMLLNFFIQPQSGALAVQDG